MNTLGRNSVADRLADLLRSLDGYDALSPGVGEEIRNILSGGIASISELGPDAVAGALFEVVKALRSRRLEPVLSLHNLPHPRYPVGVGDAAPAVGPPLWEAPVGLHSPGGGWTVLGFDVGFPIGIPSCELTRNADWIEYYARKGFCVLTYRTVRNVPTAGSPYDWVFLAGIEEPWSAPDTPSRVLRVDGPVPHDWRTISTATSFVVPCPPTHIWEADMADARRRLDRLGGHHLLIASVTDSVPLDLKTPGTIIADFVDVARRAEQAGAQAIECYLARTTARDADGRLLPCERSAETSIAIVRAVRAALKVDTRLLIKLSGDLSNDGIEQLVVPMATEKLIDGVSGISPVRVNAVTRGPDGRSLWEDKPPAVAGYALRNMSRSFVERLSNIRSTHGLTFEIIAMGGVMTAEDVTSYMRLGASAVQTATAAVCDPGLAVQAFAYHQSAVQGTEKWSGIVLEFDARRGTFWARLVPGDAKAPDEEALFDLTEVRPDERSAVQPGAVFEWRLSLIAEGGKLVRRSSLRFRPIPLLTEDYRLGSRVPERGAFVLGSTADNAPAQPEPSQSVASAAPPSGQSRAPTPRRPRRQSQREDVQPSVVPAKPTIFLCHSSGDKDAVRALYRRLKRNGFASWIDEKNLLPGQDWQLEIERAIRASDLVLMCLSRDSVSKRGFVQKEFRFALDVAGRQPEGSIFLIPVRLEDCLVPDRLSGIQWVDLFEPEGFQQLMRVLRSVAAASGLAPTRPSVPSC